MRKDKINIKTEEKIKIYSKALFVLNENNLLKVPECKNQIKLYIRQATETLLYHTTTDYFSEKAKEKIILERPLLESPRQFHNYCSKNFSHDHMVPCEVIYKLITEKDNITIEWIERELKKYCKRATITKDENNSLRRSTVPREFFHDKNSELYHNHKARYIEDEVDIILIPRNSIKNWWDEYKNNWLINP